MFVETGLEHYAKLIRRYLWLIFIIVILCTGTTFLINQNTPPVYEASALIRVHDTQANNNVLADQALAKSYALLVNSPKVLQAAAAKLPGTSLQKLTSQVSASVLDNTQILQVHATADSAHLATDMANTVAQVFIQVQTDTVTTPLKNTASKLEQNLTTAKQTLDNDQAQLAELQNSRIASQDSISHLNDSISNDQISYNTLQASYNQIEQQILQAPNTLTTVQPATLPTTSNSHTLLNALIAAALSLLIMFFFILLRDLMDTTIKTPNDVEKLAGLYALGSLPLHKKSSEEGRHETNSDAPLIQDDVIMQAFVGITAHFSSYGKGRHTFVVTSLHKKAGTSTTAANLAVALAQAGVHVLLIDAHLRNPWLQKLFQSSTAQGLTTILTDHNWLQSAHVHQVHYWLSQWQTRVPNLWFLPAGPPTSPQETVMLSPALPMLLKNVLKPMSGPIDVIILDAPPLEETTDTLALAACADASLLVIKAGKEQATMVRKAQEILTRLKAPVLGVIVNYQTKKHQSYFYVNRYRSVPPPTSNNIEREQPMPPPAPTTAGNLIRRIAPTPVVDNLPVPVEKQLDSLQRNA